MEALFTRYRNLTVLVVVVIAQLLYLAYQVKTNRDERLIRVWAVTAVTPMAGIVEGLRRNTIGFLQDYFILLDVREQNRKLKTDNDKLRMENVYFRNQLSTAEHARALTLFQRQTPSKTIASRVIGNSTVATAKAVFIDRGSTSAIEPGMAVVAPEGIIGKVTAVYPLVSQVLLVTDPTFKVGVESQKGHVHGILNCATGKCSVEQIQNEDKVDTGEWFFTSGEDRIFPRGFPVGIVVSAQPGQGMKDVKLNLSGAPAGAEQVLVVLQGIHAQIPTEPVADQSLTKMLAPPPSDAEADPENAAKPQTEADKIAQKYVAIGKEQNHVYGGYLSNLPNFNPKPAPVPGTNAAPPANQPSVTAPRSDGGSTILGARPGSSIPRSSIQSPATPSSTVPVPTPTPAQRPKTDNREVLPLGAPHRKPVSAAPAPTPTPNQ